MLDKQLTFDEKAQKLTTAASTDSIDLAVAEVTLGAGIKAVVESIVTTAMTDSGNDSTMTVTLEEDDNSSFSSPTTVATIGVFAATSAAGTKKSIVIAPDTVSQRYLRAKYTVANGDLTTGNFTTYIHINTDSYHAYPSGFTA